MLDSKNKIGDIKNSNIGSIEQTNIEKQENNITNNNITNKQVNLIVTGGDFTEVALSHNLFPDYIVATKKMHNGKYTLVSKPTSEEALKKYPYNFKSSFRVIDERYKNIKDPDLLLDMIQYADSPVEVEITKFEQYLGNVIDPYPNPEFSPMQEGTKSYIIPKKRKLPKIEFNVDIEFEKPVNPDEVREILKNSFGVTVIDNPDKFEYPTTRDASGVDPVFVGRIRKNLAFDNGISLWCVADNLRIGAALNTVRICQKVIEMELY